MIETIMTGNTSSQWIQTRITQIHVPTPHTQKMNSYTQSISIGMLLPNYQSTPVKILQSTTLSSEPSKNHGYFLDNGVSVQFSEKSPEKESPEEYALTLIRTLQSFS